MVVMVQVLRYWRIWCGDGGLLKILFVMEVIFIYNDGYEGVMMMMMLAVLHDAEHNAMLLAMTFLRRVIICFTSR